MPGVRMYPIRLSSDCSFGMSTRMLELNSIGRMETHNSSDTELCLQSLEPQSLMASRNPDRISLVGPLEDGMHRRMWQITERRPDQEPGGGPCACWNYGTLLMLLRVETHNKPTVAFEVIASADADIDEIMALRRRGCVVRYEKPNAVMSVETV